MRFAVLGAAFVLLLSGCLGASSVQPASVKLPVLPVPGLPLVQDHDHSDPALHLGHWNVEDLARSNGYAGPTPKGVGYTELDIKDGFVYQCRGGAEGGFVILDVRDPLHPKPVGQMPGNGCDDVKVNDAGDLVLYGTQRNPPAELLTRDIAPDEKLPRAVYAVNVKDKAHPFVESVTPIPINGPHTIHYVNMSGRELALVQSYDWILDGGLGTPVSTGKNIPLLTRIQIYEIAPGLDGNRALHLLSVWEDLTPPPQGQNYLPHDTTVQKHPLTGDWLAYVAYWDQGLIILDINDPANPKEVSRFKDTSPSKLVHAHQARPFPHLIDGKHVTVIEPELPSADETGQFTLVDTTDPAHPQRLGYWTLPGNLVVPGGFLYSPHNFNLANGRIYLAHYHAGVWIIDVSDAAKLAHPVAVGYAQPHEGNVAQKCGEAGRLWSAFYVQGYVYASEDCTGLHVLQFSGDKGLEGQGPMRVMQDVGEK